MNAPFIPDSHGTYADGVYALLTILSDPAAHKARLDELIAQEKATDDKIAALNEMAADTRRLHSAAEALTIVLNNRKAALDNREAELDAKAKTLDLGSAESLKRRETAVQVRENEVTRDEARLTAAKADLEIRHAKVKRLASDIS